MRNRKTWLGNSNLKIAVHDFLHTFEKLQKDLILMRYILLLVCQDIRLYINKGVIYLSYLSTTLFWASAWLPIFKADDKAHLEYTLSFTLCRVHLTEDVYVGMLFKYVYNYVGNKMNLFCFLSGVLNY